MRRAFIVLVALVAAVSVFAGGKKEEPAMQPATEQPAMAASAIKNPDTFVYATYGDSQTLDPATEYDTASSTIVKNIYEGLIAFEREDPSKFVPVLATEVPTVANGGIADGGKTYTFNLRSGVKFHNGNPLTAEDVLYTFKRNLVVDQDASWMWMLYNGLLGIGGSRDGEGNITVTWQQINGIVSATGNRISFHLTQPWAPFLSVMANTFGVIVDKEFVVANGGWDGTEATWKQFNNPETGKETLFDKANGTGPYMLARWEKGTEIVLDRFDGYWGTKPALAHGIVKIVAEWSTRKLMLVQGDADNVQVDPPYYNEMDKESGLTVQRALPSLQVTAFLFNFATVTADNPTVGSGKLDGNGVPSDFFTDMNVRMGFISAWDEATFLKDGAGGYGIDPVTPVVRGLPFRNENQKRVSFDLAKAAEYMRQAWGGQVWEKGFKMQLFYNTGNTVREIAAKMIAENMTKVNPKFQIEVIGQEWPQYLSAFRGGQLPMYASGWAPDYPDPDNYVQPFILSETGAYSGPQKYKNAEADRLITEAGFSPDNALRQKNYYRIQEIYVQDPPGTAILQPITTRYWKDWMKGMGYSPMDQSVFDWLPYLTKGM
jgi:peptide/nickel transport system substrate-binding protein